MKLIFGDCKLVNSTNENTTITQQIALSNLCKGHCEKCQYYTNPIIEPLKCEANKK